MNNLIKFILDKSYGIGFICTLFGAAGMAEYITSGKGSFIFCTVILSIGIALILNSYVWKK